MIKKNADSDTATVQPTTARNTASHRTIFKILSDDALFLASPFIALAYMLLFPFIGLAMLAKMGKRARRERAASN